MNSSTVVRAVGALALGLAMHILVVAAQAASIPARASNVFLPAVQRTHPRQSSGAWNETIIYDFQPIPNPPGAYASKFDGVYPTGILGIGNAIYGVTMRGGLGGLGTAYQLTPPSPGGTMWKERKLHNFYRPQGIVPVGGLIADANGALYGMTTFGGRGFGGVFKLTESGDIWSEETLYSFAGPAFGDGAVSEATSVGPTLYLDAHGNLFGTTLDGGAAPNGCNCGTIFELSPPTAGSAAWTETVLYSFTGGGDGAFPSGGVVGDADGNLYGTTAGGGEAPGGCGCGTIYELSAPTALRPSWKRYLIYSFQGNDGADPDANLIIGAHGYLYGTTPSNVFESAPPSKHKNAWTTTSLHIFGRGEGSYIRTSVTMDKSGTLYGTASSGGDPTCECGTVFSVAPPTTKGGSWTETTLHAFTNYNGDGDGNSPMGNIVIDGSGALYGTTAGGGDLNGAGLVFKLTPP